MTEPKRRRNPKKLEDLSPKDDFVFKRLFGEEQNKDMLLSLLNAVLERPQGEQLVDLTYMNPSLEPSYFPEKHSVLDVKVRDERGKVYNVEMQCTDEAVFENRVLYYWARLYGSQLEEAELYTKLKPVISVVITDFAWLDSKGYHSRYEVRERETAEVLTTDLEIHILELPKLSMQIEEAKEKLEKWMLFFEGR